MSWTHASQNQKKTHCKHGHAFDEANTRIRPDGGRLCKECNRAYMRDWYKKHPENVKANAKKWKMNNPGKYHSAIAKWWREHPEKKRAKDARRQERGYFKEYREKNCDKNKEYQREYYRKNKDRIALRIAKYEEANKEKLIAYRKAWRTPEKQRIANHKRKARRLSALGSHTESELIELLQKQHHRCANPYCKVLLSGGFRKTIDHIIPLSRGGSNSIENLQWLCRRCNTSKGTKNMDKWLERQVA